MKTYMGARNILVKNEEKMVYKVADFESYDNANYVTINLELVAGWDYINPDESDKQGWCGAENFIESVRYESVTCSLLFEGITTALVESGYVLVDENYNEL